MTVVLPRRLASVLLALVAWSAPASAQSPWRLSVEAHGTMPVSEPQLTWFGPGGGIALAAHLAVSESVLLGLRVRAGGLIDGAPPSSPTFADPGPASLFGAAFSLRWRPLAPFVLSPSRATGLFVDLAAGASLSGAEVRPALEAGLGYGFDLGPVVLAPVARWLAVIEVDNALDDRPAHLVTLGVELVFLDEAPPPASAPSTPPGDRDGDGLDDATDRCPDEPEDADAFQDDDGCPDADDDADGVLDADDMCRLEPEDRDGFEDTDGCPERDNDLDGWLDADDACPDEGEVINGVEDLDGCPDQGLITMIDDRIALDERVLFDFRRARVRSHARPVLQAIAELYRSSGTWTQVRLEGHADVRGSEEANQQLSERRARQVARVLVELGLPAEILSTFGFGEERPRAEGQREQDHQVNRRVELVVLSRRPLTAEELAEQLRARREAAMARRAQASHRQGGTP